MFRTFKIHLKPLLLSLLISLGAGALSAFLSGNNMSIYSQLNLPPLSPPGFIFPVVWTILYILMGISAYMIYLSGSPFKKTALIVYGTQLAVNILWSPIFFRFQLYLPAFIWLAFLWLLVILMINIFYKVNKTAAYLQLPYLLWITFAGYLNLGVYILNK